MVKRTLAVLIALAFILTAVPTLFADSGDEEAASIHLIPAMSIPIGTDADVFDFGGGGNFLVRFPIPGFNMLNIEGGFGFSLAPLKVALGMPVTNSLVWIGAVRLGAGFYLPVVQGLIIGAFAHGGYYIGGFISDPPDDTTANSPLFDAGLEVKFKFSPYMSLGVNASYRMLFGVGLTGDLLLGIGLTYHFPLLKGGLSGSQFKQYPQLELFNLTLGDVFPVFYSRYSDHPLGRIEIRNNGKIPLENVKVSLLVKDYMDNPTACGKEIAFLSGNAKAAIDLTALFNEKILDITENTKFQVRIAVECTVAGEKYENYEVRDVRVFHRNAMTWDDTRRAAAFVSLKDPGVLKFAKNVKSYIGEKPVKALNQNFLTALALFEALKLYGLTYTVDPTTPFTEYSKKDDAVDFLQFPRHTLDYKAGDCDDLSILYSALLESIGIRTAFITTPGHIYVAAALDVSGSEAQKQLLSPGDLIYRGDTVWLPVEVTALSGGFLAAWQAGIKLWKEQEPKKQAELIVVQKAWDEFRAVGLSGEGPAVNLPSKEAVQNAFMSEVMKYVDRDLYPQVKKIEEQIKADPANQALRNKLGVLYARYAVGGDYTKAEDNFKKALGKNEYAPALVNLGNIAFLKSNLSEARKYYEKAFAKDQNDPAVLLNLAKLAYEQSQYDRSDTYYSMLKKRDAALAGRFDYLARKGEAGKGRAAQADAMKDQVEWGE